VDQVHFQLLWEQVVQEETLPELILVQLKHLVDPIQFFHQLHQQVVEVVVVTTLLLELMEAQEVVEQDFLVLHQEEVEILLL
tara:strand:- start:300 stop:545 length:246 start_codon:yes stop_codon:yes gene_type:complete